MMMRSKVPGYREGLNVYQTFTCPRTDSAWTSASLRMNCKIGGDQLYNHYYCIPNAERTHFVEFCYDRASMKTEKGNCWELGGMGYLNQVNCTNFVRGCPDYTYLSERVYKIPACLDLNFSERCFTEEPGCTVLKNSTNALVHSQNSANTSLHLGLVALITSVLTAVILLLVVFGTKRLRRRRLSREETDSKLHLNPQGVIFSTTQMDAETQVSEDLLPSIGKKSDDKKDLSHEENKQPRRPPFERGQSCVASEQDIKPLNVKGHISHLYVSTTGDIWASNDRGKVGLIDTSGNNERSIETCSTYSGHFTIATVDKEEHIYWVHNEKKFVKRDNKETYEINTGKWAPISILFSAEEMFYVGKVKDNDAKITRYNTDWTTKDDIHRYKAEKEETRNLFRYPAYLVKNINGDLCVSDNIKRVIVVDNNNKFRFKYTGPDQNGFAPYGICTDSKGCILIVDSSSMCIHIINQEGILQHKIIMSKHLKEPRGLCMDKDGNCYVGTYGTILVNNTPGTTTAKTESVK